MTAERVGADAASAPGAGSGPGDAPGRSWDVVVVGLGIMGAAALWALARRGVAVLGLERFSPGHDRGSSHGESRIIRTAYFEGPVYVPLAQRAFELWEELERRAGRRLLVPTGALMIGAPDSPVVAGTLASAEAWRLPHEVLDAAALRRRFPALSPPADAVGVFETRAGALDPEASLAALLHDAQAHGAEWRGGLRVRGWEEADGGRLRIWAEPAPEAGPAGSAAGPTGSAPEGREPLAVLARRVVLCAGPWTAELLPGRFPLWVERQVMHWFDVAGVGDEFGPGRLPVFIWQRRDGEQFYGLPALEGGLVKFCRHHGGEATTPDAVERAVRPADIEAVEAARRELLPGLAPGPVRSKTCLYTNTPDEHFCIGPLPEEPRVVLACGFSGHGFKFAPVVGEILADFALEGRTEYPADRFAPARFGA
ncbi:MAG: FAD-dependent oxidoreductase [Clostridia bacterium]|nr:FAD-dependent oxidoreductase [Clostridia bacterium]